MSHGPHLRVLLIRHGETDWNLQRRYQGRTDVPLNATGRAEAARLATALAETRVDAVYTSPLIRAADTAAPVAARWGLAPVVDEQLLEMDFGGWDGLTFGAIGERWPELQAAWLRDPQRVAPPGGETLQAVARRMARLRRRLAAQHEGQTVALFTHVAPIKAFVLGALKLPLRRHLQFWLDRGSLSVVDFGPVGAVLMAFNQRYRID